MQSDSTDTKAPILVTGATGNVGREVVKELSRRAVRCIAAVSDVSAARRVLGPDVQTRVLDFLQPETYEPALAGVRGLFLLRPPAVANTRDTLNVLIDRALANGVEHIVFLSVAGADRQRWVPHHAVELHLAKMRASATILRPGFFAQNLGDAYRDDIRARRELFVPAGRGRVAFVDVRDVAEVAASAFLDASVRGRNYMLTGPEAISFSEVASTLSTELGMLVRYRPASVPGYVRHLRARHMPLVQVAVQTLLHVGLRFGNGAEVDPTLARLLGRPARTVCEYIHDHRSLWLDANPLDAG